MIGAARNVLLQFRQLEQLLLGHLRGQFADDHHVLGNRSRQLLELRIGFDEIAHVRYALHLLLALGADLKVVHQRLDCLADLAEIRVDVLCE